MPSLARFTEKVERVILGAKRATILLIELGFTAAGLIATLYWLSWARDSWVAYLIGGDGIGWALLVNVLAFFLAFCVERQRWIRWVSVILHTGLVLLVVFIMIDMHFELFFPD